MVATYKIVCDRVEMLKAVGHFLDTEPREMQRMASGVAGRGGA
jgi:hypothetical protein